MAFEEILFIIYLQQPLNSNIRWHMVDWRYKTFLRWSGFGDYHPHFISQLVRSRIPPLLATNVTQLRSVYCEYFATGHISGTPKSGL